jgi:hypothetical protein
VPYLLKVQRWTRLGQLRVITRKRVNWPTHTGKRAAVRTVRLKRIGFLAERELSSRPNGQLRVP